jgi:hypothetical protein
VFALLLALGAAPAPGYNLYLAVLHSHTGYSDGVRTPREAFIYARDTARIHVLGVSDHDWMLDWDEWVATGRQADSATEPGRFLALRGFEWSGSDDGHVNVFETDTFVSRENVPGMSEFYPWLIQQPAAIGQFNHLGSGDFDNYRYVAAADSQMTLCEMKTMPQSRKYSIALDSGWVCGAASSMDTHLADWGMGPNLTGIWADSLTRGSILAAIRAMRTYATLNREVRLEFTCNGAWMGSRLGNGSLHFNVRASSPNPADTIRRVLIVTNGGTTADSILVGDRNTVDWSPSLATASGERRWFFARVVWGDSVWTTSSAIWTAGPAAIGDRPVAALPRTVRLELAPNPARAGSAVRLTAPGCGPGELSVVDALGRVILRRAIDNRNSSFDIPALGAGVFLVRFISAGATASAKLLVR